MNRKNIKARSTNTNQTLGPSNLGSSDKKTRTPSSFREFHSQPSYWSVYRLTRRRRRRSTCSSHTTGASSMSRTEASAHSMRGCSTYSIYPVRMRNMTILDNCYFTEKDRKACGHAQKLTDVHVPIVLPQVHQLDNLSFWITFGNE